MQYLYKNICTLTERFKMFLDKPNIIKMSIHLNLCNPNQTHNKISFLDVYWGKEVFQLTKDFKIYLIKLIMLD